MPEHRHSQAGIDWLNETLQPREHPSGGEIRLANDMVKLSLDESDFQVYLHDKSVSFRIREFAVLYYLGQKADQVRSRNDTYKDLWDMDYTVTPSKTLDVHIGTIRSRFGKRSGELGNPYTGFIKSERMIGFMALSKLQDN